MVKGEYGGQSDIEMEKFVLSALMLKGGEAVPVAAGILKAEDFYRPEHRKLYRAMLRIYDGGTAPNLLTLIAELQKTGELGAVGLELVYSLAEYANTTAYVESYARELKEKSILRALTRVGEEIAQAAYEGQTASAEILGEAERKICGLYMDGRRTDFEHVEPILMRALTEIGTRLEGAAKYSGVPSGFVDLDELTNGFQRADLILLAARPSMGKTALALNMAANAALSGKTVAVFSFEMSKAALAKRLLVSQARVDSAKVQNGTLTAEEYSELLNAADVLSRLKLYISDTAETTIAELRSKARRQKMENDVELIIIDYLQLMTGEGENRQQEISAISRSLKGLARELAIPIIALSQLSRQAELRADKRPLLSDLRESGALEQDADMVMFLYREDYYDHESEKANVAELIIAKNRNGATRTLNLYFDRACMRFEALAEG